MYQRLYRFGKRNEIFWYQLILVYHFEITIKYIIIYLYINKSKLIQFIEKENEIEQEKEAFGMGKKGARQNGITISNVLCPRN